MAARIKKRAGSTTNRESDKFIVRLPTGMREVVAKIAERNGRSMNAEIVNAIAQQISRAGTAQRPPAQIAKLMNEAIAERIRSGDVQLPLREMAERLEAVAADLDALVKQSRASAEEAIKPDEG